MNAVASRRSQPSRRLGMALAVVVSLAACGSAVATTLPTPAYVGAQISPARIAPPLTLTDYQGKTVSVTQYRGKVLLVAWLYSHCPTACPLIAEHLKSAVNQLGAKGADVQLLAVTTDPAGDTPASVAAFLDAHGLKGRMDYLIGSEAQLEPIWLAWHIDAFRDAQDPALINHSDVVYGIAPSGKLTTLYFGNFKTADIVHDVPLLASAS